VRYKPDAAAVVHRYQPGVSGSLSFMRLVLERYCCEV
jgi:hypothetical protein